MQQSRFLFLVTKEFLSDISPEEQDELSRYLRNHDDKRKEHQLLKQYWENRESRARDNERLFDHVLKKIAVAESNLNTGAQTRTRQGKWRKYTVAASVVLLLGLSFFYFHSNKLFFSFDKHELVTGLTKRSITLTDGTAVTLNASSKLIYPKTGYGNQREVYLEGEAFFDVAKNEKYPFIIHTTDMDIKVLGTSFNVRAYTDEQKTETSLISGAIEISLPKHPNKKIRLNAKDKLILKKPQPSSVEDQVNNPPVPALELAEITYYKPKDDTTIIETSWLQNKLAFKNEKFEDIAKRLEKHFGVSIGFESPKVKEYKFNGVFVHENIQEILYALHLAAPFGYRIQGKKIQIYD